MRILLAVLMNNVFYASKFVEDSGPEFKNRALQHLRKGKSIKVKESYKKGEFTMISLPHLPKPCCAS